MAEILFVLVTVYAVYVIHRIVTCKESSKGKPLKTPASFLKKEIEGVASKIEVKPSVENKPVAVKKTKTEAEIKLPSGNIRHPETGEVVKMASSYRMTKRWIKEALVTEGLLEKIYKTSEIDDVVQGEINQALDKLKSMDKYQSK